MREISENIRKVEAEIVSACRRVARHPSEVTLVAATKGVGVDRIREAIKAGLTLFGENRVQEATTKIAALSDNPQVRWHLIGHLQTNKARKAVELFGMIQSLDSMRLAEKLNAYASEQGKIMPVLIEVNIGGEETKHGVRPEDLRQLVQAVAALRNIKVRGLMAVPPYCENPEEARPYFRKLRELAEDLKRAELPNVQMVHLSMGMSHDFTVAIEEGATMVRIGTAIFGPRA